jgi:hypothetical protein
MLELLYMMLLSYRIMIVLKLLHVLCMIVLVVVRGAVMQRHKVAQAPLSRASIKLAMAEVRFSSHLPFVNKFFFIFAICVLVNHKHINLLFFI